MKKTKILGYDDDFVKKMNSYNLLVDYKIQQCTDTSGPGREIEEYKIEYDGATIIRITNCSNDICMCFHEKINNLFLLKDINLEEIIEVLTTAHNKCKAMSRDLERLNLKPVSDRVE